LVEKSLIKWALMTKEMKGQHWNEEIKNREINCEDINWMELAQENAQWCALVVAVLNLWALLPESYLNVRTFVSPCGSPEFPSASVELSCSVYVSLKKE
jgi:hypothetical protein